MTLLTLLGGRRLLTRRVFLTPPVIVTGGWAPSIDLAYLHYSVVTSLRGWALCKFLKVSTIGKREDRPIPLTLETCL
jgi:hypothetical protein